MASITQSKNGAILIVDDSESVRFLIKDAIASSVINRKILEADNGIDAVKLFKEAKPELVILDIFMPRADGIQVLKGLLLLDKTTKVIVTSSIDNEKFVQDAVKIGARAKLIKPFDKIMALNVITKVLNQPW